MQTTNDFPIHIGCRLVSRSQTAFFRFSLGWREKGLVWFTVATRLGTPRCGGGVNGGNVICYCFIVTRAISVVLYKRVSLKIGAYENGYKVCCCDGGRNNGIQTI